MYAKAFILHTKYICLWAIVWLNDIKLEALVLPSTFQGQHAVLHAPYSLIQVRSEPEPHKTKTNQSTYRASHYCIL